MNTPPQIALIQLVSEQAMPNLLAALAIKPAKFYFLLTSRMHGAASNLKRALARADIHKPEKDLPLGEMPDIEESASQTLAAIRSAQAGGYIPVVNYTGGTN